MTLIIEKDIKLLKSENISDFDEGGGRVTGNEVLNGVVNELFPDISQLDRTYGRVSLRKAYMACRSKNDGTYLGAHAILISPPVDPSVNVTIFSTNNWTDTRVAARQRVESYSIPGPPSRWILFGDHITGQRAIRVYSVYDAVSAQQGTGDPTPEIGSVMLLSIEKAGYTPHQQYVRITKLSSRTVMKFSDERGDFYKDVAVLEIGNPLRYDFPGGMPSRGGLGNSPTAFRDTIIADAAQYYGVKPLQEDAAIHSLTVKVDSPYSPLVPSAHSETPILNNPASSAPLTLKQSGNANSLVLPSITRSSSTGPDYSVDVYFLRPFMRKSLNLNIGGTAYIDDGNGRVVLPSGAVGAFDGFIDYGSGKISLIHPSGPWSSDISGTATPAGPVFEAAHTLEVPITSANRQYNYTVTLLPYPAPGALQISYRSLGKWITLRDNGNGAIVGTAGTGSGTIDYQSGGVILTVGAPPDTGSSIIYTWGTSIGPQNLVGDTYIKAPTVIITLSHTGVIPGRVFLSW